MYTSILVNASTRPQPRLTNLPESLGPVLPASQPVAVGSPGRPLSCPLLPFVSWKPFLCPSYKLALPTSSTTPTLNSNSSHLVESRVLSARPPSGGVCEICLSLFSTLFLCAVKNQDPCCGNSKRKNWQASLLYLPRVHVSRAQSSQGCRKLPSALCLGQQLLALPCGMQKTKFQDGTHSFAIRQH